MYFIYNICTIYAQKFIKYPTLNLKKNLLEFWNYWN